MTLILLIAGVALPLTSVAQTPALEALARSVAMSDQNFGRAVALDGVVAVVGAVNEDESFTIDVGAAYFYRHDGSTWIEEARVISSAFNNFNGFGTSVAVSGDVAAVAEPDGDLLSTNAGNVFVYRHAGGNWSVETTLLPPAGTEENDYASSVALDGNVLAVGVPSGNGVVNGSGLVVMYRYDGAIWQPDGILAASDGGLQDLFGSAIDIDGDRMVISAFNANDGTNNQAGKLYVFEYDGAAWHETAILKADDSNSIANLGVSVALEGDWIVGGAQLNSTLQAGAGAAYVFRYDGGAWDFYQKLTASDGEGFFLFGSSVALSGNRILAGAENWAPPGGDSTGKVYRFEHDPLQNAWIETVSYTPADLTRAARFGHAVAIDGEAMLMGAPDWDGAQDEMGNVYALGMPRVATAIETEHPMRTLRVEAPYPNPFAHATTVTVAAEAEETLNMRLFDLLGREVRSVFHGRLPAGAPKTIHFQAGDLPAGVYLLRIDGDGFSETHRLVRMK